MIDLPVDFNELLAVEIAREGSYRGDDPIDLQDNVAIAIFDVLASGNDTFVAVDVYALAIEDELSEDTATFA